MGAQSSVEHNFISGKFFCHKTNYENIISTEGMKKMEKSKKKGVRSILSNKNVFTLKDIKSSENLSTESILSEKTMQTISKMPEKSILKNRNSNIALDTSSSVSTLGSVVVMRRSVSSPALCTNRKHLSVSFRDHELKETKNYNRRSLNLSLKPRRTDKERLAKSQEVLTASLGSVSHRDTKTPLRKSKSADLKYETQFIRERKHSLPGNLQRKFNFEKERRRRSSYRRSLSDELSIFERFNVDLPLKIPLNCKLTVKLSPQSTPFDKNKLEHFLYLLITPTSDRELQKTGHQYKAKITLIEGLMEVYEDASMNTGQRHLVRTHTWSGSSHFVDFVDKKLSISGNFYLGDRDVLSYLEFELVLYPNYKQQISVDNNLKLLAIGLFEFRDSRNETRKKALRWLAAVEDTLFDFGSSQKCEKEFDRNNMNSNKTANKDNCNIKETVHESNINGSTKDGVTKKLGIAEDNSFLELEDIV